MDDVVHVMSQLSSCYPIAWITHISADIICKLVDDAMKKKLDPRQDPKTTITDGFSLSCEDVKKLWFYIGREVS